MKRTVIFDLDGTLADTSGDLLRAANAALADLGAGARLDPADPEDRATALKGARAMLRRALGRDGAADEGMVDRGVPPLLDAYRADIAAETRFYPGALDAVDRLRARGDRVGICTNKPEGLAEALMRALGARDRFHALLGADTLPVRKPDPLHLTETVARAGGAVDRAVLVGDTVTDIDAAAAAGMPCILVTFAGHDLSDLVAAARLDDYRDLDAAVDRLLP